jgi:hypothetical protein
MSSGLRSGLIVAMILPLLGGILLWIRNSDMPIQQGTPSNSLDQSLRSLPYAGSVAFQRDQRQGVTHYVPERAADGVKVYRGVQRNACRTAIL